MSHKRLIVMSVGDGCESVFADLFDSVEFYDFSMLSTHAYKLDEDCVVLFEGGVDINPEYYGQQSGKWTNKPNISRDMHEFAMFHASCKAGAGQIGICRGAQLITAALGGMLIQHVTGHRTCDGTIQLDNSLKACIGTDVVQTPEDHHQMMNPLPIQRNKWELLAWSKNKRSVQYLDGTDTPMEMGNAWQEPEIVYYRPRALAIQGHPEWSRTDSHFHMLCRELVKKFIFNKENQ
jgi:GMP synthase-like glutamine amidotransferase